MQPIDLVIINIIIKSMMQPFIHIHEQAYTVS